MFCCRGLRSKIKIKRGTLYGIFLLIFMSVTLFLSSRDIFSNKLAVTSKFNKLDLAIARGAKVNHLTTNSLKSLTTTRVDPFSVPNIVHYVWLEEKEEMQFYQFLSLKSVSKYMNPDIIYFHCDNEPTGIWWQEAKYSIKMLRIENMEPPTEILGNEVTLSRHKSDIARIEILIKHGGIYIDTDVFVIKSFDPLRKYNFTMGIEYHGNPGRLNNGVIVAAKGAPFLHKWYDTYRNFTEQEQDFHASIIPYYLQYHYPDLIHIEEKSINYPSGERLDLIYDQVYDWSDNYCIHLWSNLHRFDHSLTDIYITNTTLGQLVKFIMEPKNL